MSGWEALVSGDELKRASRERKKKYKVNKEKRSAIQDLEADGWEFVSEYKDTRYIKVKKKKPCWERFENRVWILFFNMGYTHMNPDNSFKIQIGKGSEVRKKQIDVFAYDGETAIVVECKAADLPGTKKDFRTEIESLANGKQRVIGAIRNQFGKSVKVKFIFATSNYVLGKMDKERLRDEGLEYFNDESVEYYLELTKHLGSAAKYQLLGRLFKDSKIGNMEDAVPAIRGKMGGHTYYSFSIEPERLLKIGYVLHRNDANLSMMPTYQRVIKQSRLKNIRSFIEQGGYFPNSIIISINAPRNGLTFDIKQGADSSIAQLGILHLPKKYCSAYIIDGQHRLYGYSDTRYATTNTIPVVAFENLDQNEQLRIFMEINENQKAVSKNLRNTLGADLLWTSDSFADRRKALRLRVAEKLGEMQDSPLYGHILVGENTKTAVRCITLESIERGISRGGYLAEFEKNNTLSRMGLFDDGQPDNTAAFNRLMKFLTVVFKYISDQIPEEWKLGESSGGILTINTGIQAFLMVLGDILKFCEDQKQIIVRHSSIDQIMNSIQGIVDIVIEFYKTIDPDLRMEIKKKYGSSAPVFHWRYLQKAIHDKIPDFLPQDFEVWWADNSKQYNEDSELKLREIRDAIVDSVHGFLETKGIELPYGLSIDLGKNLVEINARRKQEGLSPKGEWDIFSLKDCHTLAHSGSLWTEGLKELLTRPEDRTRKGGNKVQKTKWLLDLDGIIKSLRQPGYSVKSADYVYITAIYNWLFPRTE